MSFAVAPAGDGAPLGDIALVGGIISAATIAVLAIIVWYRGGGAWPVRLADRYAKRYLGLPGWAAIPGLLAIGAGVLTFMGAIWDIGVHIDKGRDNGPFGTTAHYPMLVGLVGVYLCGVFAVGVAPQERGSRASVRLPGLGPVPVGALLILAGGGYAMLGFPLDDLWHRIFGQDVTLWGPTHTMFFGGLIAGMVGAVILLAEGARSLGKRPFGAPWKPIGAVAGGIFLFVGTHVTDEFNWAVPQYRAVWQPLMLAAFGGLALVLTRSLGGRGATIGALLAYLPLQIIEVVMIGALGTTQPAFPLFIAEALVVEVAFVAFASRGALTGGALAGLGVGTLGFGAEYAWSQVAMPLPWQPGLIAEGLPVAALAGLAGGLIATALATALNGGGTRTTLAVALGAGVLAIGLGVDAGISTEPAARATITLSGVRDGKADVSVRLSRPDLVDGGNWAYILGWQGDGRYAAPLRKAADGTLRSTERVPISGGWKSFVRIHKGRALIAAPIRMPADPALGFKGFAAPAPTATRAMQRDTRLLQIERKDDGPLWAWTPALLLVQVLNLVLMAAVGAAAVRTGRTARTPVAA